MTSPRTEQPRTSKAKSGPMVSEDQIKGSMHTEEPMGADLSQDSPNPRMKRHPRPDGKGGIVPAHEEGEGIIEERE